MTHSNTIREWFDTEFGGGLILPDGWFGRPYDSQHSLTDIEEHGSDLVMVLDEHLRLHFSGLKSVAAKGEQLVFGPFKSLRFGWVPFDGGKMQVKEYQGGEVVIASGPG